MKNLFNHLTADLAQKEGITEQRKAADQMKWVQQINNLRERVTETVYSDVVFV